jgi:hypothetical protein
MRFFPIFFFGVFRLLLCVAAGSDVYISWMFLVSYAVVASGW